MEEIKLPLQSVTKVIGLDTVDSTQSLAKVLAQQGAEDGTLVLAGEQTAGRGRYDRSFSAAHGGVYFTLILRPGKPVSANSSLRVRVGQAVAETISSVFNKILLLFYRGSSFSSDIYFIQHIQRKCSHE